MKRRPSSFRVRSTGFTLLELLAVIAVIGILAALIFPSVGAARRSAHRTKTKVQFNQWAAAIEGFRSEYGYYPVFHAENLVNPPAQSTTAGTVHLFHDLLAGRRRNGEALPAYSASSNVQLPEVQNRKRIVFFSFSAADLTDDTSRTPNLVRDAFDNVSIAVLVDRNLDGVINATDYPVYPAVATREGGSIRPGAAQIPAAGVRAGVIFYAPDPDATAANPEFILSWK